MGSILNFLILEVHVHEVEEKNKGAGHCKVFEI